MIPPALQAGFAWEATPGVTLLADWKRIWYSDVESVGNPFAFPIAKTHGLWPIAPAKFGGQPVLTGSFAACFGLCKGALGGGRLIRRLVGHLNSPFRLHVFDIPRLHPSSRDTT